MLYRHIIKREMLDQSDQYITRRFTTSTEAFPSINQKTHYSTDLMNINFTEYRRVYLIRFAQLRNCISKWYLVLQTSKQM